ncbi:ABC transporter permease [Pusillimonas sp. NJUB218]|uniref:ABC transporter permease n=1 Tax=Pusillimonas sp. NJUB218 TaxID=2023230 RepID=UPI001F386B26|nr:ABC transporter permease [Pusillimonas sp. NJUB218]
MSNTTTIQNSTMTTQNKPKSNLGLMLHGAMPTIILTAITLILWEVITHVFAIEAFVLPAPSAILNELINQQALLAASALVTAEEIVYGFLLSMVVGVFMALIIVRFDWLGRAVYPLMVLFQNVPKIALAPLFILWFGYDLAPKLLLIVVMAFFPIALNMLVGLQSVDPNLVTLLKTVGATRNEILWRVRIPNSLPYLMSGLKIAVTLASIGAIVGEFAGASAGLGYLILFASTQMETALVFAAVVEVSILGMLCYYVVEFVEWRFITWAPKS